MTKLKEKYNLKDEDILATVKGRYQGGVIKPLKKVPFSESEVVIVFINQEKKEFPVGNGPQVLKALKRAQKTLGKEFTDFDLDAVRKKINQDFEKRLKCYNW